MFINRKKYENEITNLKMEIIGLNDKVSQLMTENTLLKDRETDINKIKAEVSKLNKEIFMLRNEKNNLNQLKDVMYARILELEKEETKTSKKTTESKPKKDVKSKKKVVKDE